RLVLAAHVAVVEPHDLGGVQPEPGRVVAQVATGVGVGAEDVELLGLEGLDVVGAYTQGLGRVRHRPALALARLTQRVTDADAHATVTPARPRWSARGPAYGHTSEVARDRRRSDHPAGVQQHPSRPGVVVVEVDPPVGR